MCVSWTGNYISIDKANFTRKLKQNLNLLVYAFFVMKKTKKGMVPYYVHAMVHFAIWI